MGAFAPKLSCIWACPSVHPQRCKNSSPTIWIWWYPTPRLKKNVLISAIGWCKLFVMVVCHFHGKKLFCVKKRWKKAFFLAAVKLHWPTSENHFSHNLWCYGWMPVCFEMIGPSPLLWYWPNKNVDLVLGIFCLFIKFLVGFLWKSYFLFMAILVIRNLSS